MRGDGGSSTLCDIILAVAVSMPVLSACERASEWVWEGDALWTQAALGVGPGWMASSNGVSHEKDGVWFTSMSHGWAFPLGCVLG